MNATTTVASNNPGAAPSGGLSYLRRPTFFRDQLLTDQDLGAVTSWVQAKFDLRRMLHGWGVVCGLAVFCDPAAKSSGSVFVGPGYALDSAGRDIVVAEQDSLDLSATCLSPGGRCAPPPPAVGGTLFGVPASQISAFDLYITYAESGADARHVPRRGTCKDATGCEYARQIEKYKLSVSPVPPEVKPPATDPNKAWPAYEQWRTDAHALVNYAKNLFGGGDAKLADLKARLADLKARLADWIAPNQRPPFQLGFLADRIAKLTANEADAARLVFWLLQDGRARLLSCACPWGSECGVPLARVWLWATQDNQSRPGCQVIGIDATPPHRRPLRLDPCWSAPSNEINLARWLGFPADDSLKGALAEWDIAAPDSGEVTYSFADLNNFSSVIDAPFVVQRGTKLTAVKSLDLGDPLGKRAAAFLT